MLLCLLQAEVSRQDGDGSDCVVRQTNVDTKLLIWQPLFPDLLVECQAEDMFLPTGKVLLFLKKMWSSGCNDNQSGIESLIKSNKKVSHFLH